MALFQRANPETAMVAKLGVKTAERDKLASRLASAAAAVVDAKAAAVKLAADGADDAALDKAEETLRKLLDRITTLRQASVELDAVVAVLERDLAAHRDTVQRTATAAQIETMAHDLDTLVPEFQKLFDKTATIARLAANSEIWDAAGLLNYATASGTQIPAAYDLVVRSLRERRDRVLDGRSPAKLTEPDAPRPVILKKEPDATRVFAIKPVKWTVDGKLTTMCKLVDVDLPPNVAAHALSIGACMPIDSDVRRQWAGSRPQSHPDLATCVSLDKGGDTTAIIQSDPQFQRLNVGEPYTVEIGRNEI